MSFSVLSPLLISLWGISTNEKKNLCCTHGLGKIRSFSNLNRQTPMCKIWFHRPVVLGNWNVAYLTHAEPWDLVVSGIG